MRSFLSFFAFVTFAFIAAAPLIRAEEEDSAAAPGIELETYETDENLNALADRIAAPPVNEEHRADGTVVQRYEVPATAPPKGSKTVKTQMIEIVRSNGTVEQVEVTDGAYRGYVVRQHVSRSGLFQVGFGISHIRLSTGSVEIPTANGPENFANYLGRQGVAQGFLIPGNTAAVAQIEMAIPGYRRIHVGLMEFGAGYRQSLEPGASCQGLCPTTQQYPQTPAGIAQARAEFEQTWAGTVPRGYPSRWQPGDTVSGLNGDRAVTGLYAEVAISHRSWGRDGVREISVGEMTALGIRVDQNDPAFGNFFRTELPAQYLGTVNLRIRPSYALSPAFNMRVAANKNVAVIAFTMTLSPSLITRRGQK